LYFKLIQLALVAAFYIAYFCKQLSLRKNGISTNRLAKGRKPRRTQVIEALLLPATYGTAVIQFASIFFSSYLMPFGFPTFLNIVGMTVTALGVLFFILATTIMRDSWRAGVDEGQKTTIVTDGVYRFSRNPAFVGFDLLYIGSFLASPNLFMLITAVFTIVLLHLQILEEEKYLPQAFGEEYLKYKASTPRYLFF